jgi:hypothetical protein
MAHIRQQIRDAFATTLTGLTTTGANVYKARVEPLEIENLPALVIQTPADERMGASGPPPRAFHRNLTVVVQGYALTGGAVVDTLDTIAAEVETAVANNYTMGGLLKDCLLSSTEISTSGESAQPSGVLTMEFAAIYHHTENAPESAI